MTGAGVGAGRPARGSGVGSGGVRARVTAERKAHVLRLVSDGWSINAACGEAGVGHESWYRWKRIDAEFLRASVGALERGARSREIQRDRGENGLRSSIGFEDFRLEFLHSRTFPHHRNMIDVIAGRPPSWLHPSMVFEAGEPNFVLVNMPPEHAKSTVATIDYATWRVCTDPNSRGMIVSKTANKAKEFMYAVKQRLTHPRFRDLQVAFGPSEGFERSAASWQSDTIYLGAEVRDSAEKDPTLQSLGMGGQIYGSRADYIIIDDAITLSNAHEFEKQIRWIQQEVLTRLGPNGLLLVVGTRVDHVDMYREMCDPERYPSGKSPWTVLRMPAVLEFAEDPADWVTLWPVSDRPWQGAVNPVADSDGLFPRWDGAHLHRRRSLLDPKTWAMVYQQADVDVEQVFDTRLVRASVDRMRKIGPLIHGAPGHPDVTEGLTVIAGLDPAIAGDLGAVVMAVDRQTRHRWVLDCAKITSPTPLQIRELIFGWTERYGITEWRIEKNAFQGYLTQDEAVRQRLASQGVLIREHVTHANNKWDRDYGVAAMATLFGQLNLDLPVGDHLIHLPSTETEGVRALVEQLITWSPETRNKTDMVMALWFCEIRARELVQSSGAFGGTHLRNRFLTPLARERQTTVNLDELAAAGRLNLIAGEVVL